jgi:hypothetical protein
MPAPTVNRRPARLGLILAALLHLLSAAGGVWFHSHAAVPAGEVVAFTAPDDGERSGAPVHNELTCTVCQLFGAHAIPGTALTVHDPLTANATPVAPAYAPRPATLPLFARPRAPPTA